MRTKPKKALGQNFLVDPNIRRKIVAACGFESSDTVLEIGAGRGELTSLIAAQVAKLLVVEIDRRLTYGLQKLLRNAPNAVIINKDILSIQLNEYIGGNQKIKIVGNIPYYISSPILTYIIRNRANIGQAFLTVQKEFAERIAAGAGSKAYGSLSCFVQYYALVELVFPIKKTCFAPVPKVDSAFISLAMRRKPAVRVEDEDHFFSIIRSAFQQRRKTLRNSLKGVISEEKIEHFFKATGIERGARPEQLSLDDFARLASLADPLQCFLKN
jgi:16S rRNA (adenine1518-N6/adenine1519-N6)-dimethyltransferase